jgi:iron complex outermembrane recepter protein
MEGIIMQVFRTVRARYVLMSTVAALATMGASAAYAQDTAPPAASATPDQATAAPTTTSASPQDATPAADVATGDIVVTANRRAQSLSTVGMSVSSLDGSMLLERGVVSASDLQKTVPCFSAADTGLNVPVYSIRGVGFNDSSLASNSTVAISVDEVPLPYSAMTQGAVLDLQRIEVLKGPQGTLYGQNATGGAINYIANAPTDTFAMGGQVGFGRFNTGTGEMYVSGPLSNTVKARVAVNGTLGGDWQRSFTRDAGLGQAAKGSGRILLNWTPTDRLTLDFNANGWIDRSDTQASQLVAFRAQTPSSIPLLPDVFSSPLTPDNARAADWNPLRDYARDDNFYQLSLKANYDMGGNVDLTSITAYSHYDTHAFNDRDGMVPINYEYTTDGNIKSIYQELRLSGRQPGLNWSVGGNYRKDTVFDQQDNDLTRATNSYAAGTKFNIARVFSDQDIKTWAVFGDGELDIVRSLSIVAGVRYTRDTRDFAGASCDNGAGDTSALYTILSRVFRARAGLAPLPAIAPGQCVTLSTGTFVPGIVRNRLSEDNVAFRAGINFKPVEGSLLYASFSRGYKAGSFPTLGAAFAIGYDAATQERVDAIEAGFKTALFDRRIRLNGAVFHYDYRDKQLRGRILDPVVGNLSRLVNIPRSTIRGFELEATARPVNGLTLNGAVSYLKTEVKEFIGINLLSQTENFAGQTLPYTPPWSVNAGTQYEWGVSARLKAFIGADYTYRSRTSGFLGRDPDVDIKAYSTVDARIGIADAGDRWKLTAWSNNLTNTYYWTSAMRTGDTMNRYAARPVTYGLLFGFTY